jgi:predicted AAA+ superfamily ATPase
LLILDEIQKISNWSDIVKKLWDEDTSHKLNLKVLLLGSATLLIQTGLGESLAGRIEVIPVPHWSFSECREAFDSTFEQYAYFGGYPGAVRLIEDEDRWSLYIIDSIIETIISRDIMLMSRIHNPALLRSVFELGCHYTGHILSYQKMLGQLQDAGNSSTLAHYLELLSQAGLVTGLKKFYPHHLHQRASNPKLQVFNTALTTAQSHFTFERMQQNQEAWDNLVTTCIGAHLLNSSLGTKTKIFYWKEGSQEIDFIVQKRETVLSVRVKNTKKEKYLPEFDKLEQILHPYSQKSLLVGKYGIPVEDFLLTPLEYWIDSAADNIRKRA